MARLDRTNLRILEVLQENGRATLSEMAHLVHRAETTVRERVMALERDGYVRGYRADVDFEKLGYRTQAFVRAEVDFTLIPQTMEKLRAIPQVRSLYLMTGQRPLHIEIWTQDPKELSKLFQRRIGPLGLKDVEVSLVVDRIVSRRPLPVPEGRPEIPPTAPGTNPGQDPLEGPGPPGVEG